MEDQIYLDTYGHSVRGVSEYYLGLLNGYHIHRTYTLGYLILI